MSTEEHKKEIPNKIGIGVLTISTTRTLSDDKSGNWLVKEAKKEGFTILFHHVVTDDIFKIRSAVREYQSVFSPDAVIVTGGTGLSKKDVTIEALTPLFEKELTAFGPIFAQLSFDEIDSAAIMSRATAGICGNTVLFLIPGSIKAVMLAANNLIFPELGHILKHMKTG